MIIMKLHVQYMIEVSVKAAGLDKTTVLLGWILFSELFTTLRG